MMAYIEVFRGGSGEGERMLAGEDGQGLVRLFEGQGLSRQAAAAISREAAEGCHLYVDAPLRLEVLDGVNHWIPEVAPDALNRLLAEHLAAH